METTQQKYWPDAKVPEGLKYIGSILDQKERYDLYLEGTTVHYWCGKDLNASCTVRQIEFLAPRNGWHALALGLLSAHRAARPAPPADPRPTVDSDEGRRMIEAAAKASYESGYVFKWDDKSEDDQQEALKEMETALLAIGVLRPAPPPAPVEPVKTVGEKIAEKLLYTARVGLDPQSSMFCIGNAETTGGMGLFEVRHGETDRIGQPARLKYAREEFAKAIDAALSAQAESHRREMAGLTEKVKNVILNWYPDRKLLAQALDAVLAPQPSPATEAGPRSQENP